jgi:hypothetical protein
MPLKDHVCPVDGCYRSFHTERGVEYHLERGNHDTGGRL